MVSSLLLQIDNLPSHVVVVTATNHPELLDRAVWRRFQVRLELPPPTAALAEEFLGRFFQDLGGPLRISSKTISRALKGASYSELEDFTCDVARRHVLALPESRLRRWQQGLVHATSK